MNNKGHNFSHGGMGAAAPIPPLFLHFMTARRRCVSWLRRLGAALMLTPAALFLMPTTAHAAGINDSKLAEGTKNLINDATTWMLVLAPIAAGLCIIYFCIRRAASDEMDVKKWNNRIVAAIVSCIGAVVASATLNVLTGYFQ